MTSLTRATLAALTAALVLPGGVLAATTVGQLFPSNIYTAPDATQVTGLHVALPQPNCATNPSDCADVASLDQLDGFNIQPRLTIPFSAPVDPNTISSSTVFLVGPSGNRIGINQVVVSADMKTVYAESDQQLAQDATYLLVVTTGVHDANGDPVDASTFRHDLNFGQTKDPTSKAYRKSILEMLPLAGPVDVAGASVFTTQSITANAVAIRDNLLHGSAVDFNLGIHGERTVFPGATTTVLLSRQNNTSSLATPSPIFAPGVPLWAGIGTIAFGSYASPNFETSQAVIPAVGTKTVPAVQSTSRLEFTLWVPAGTAPAGGWPTAIFGHGFTDSKDGAPIVVAGTLAQNGIATIAINVVGHGGGPGGVYNALTPTGVVTLPSGGRAVDQNGDGSFDSTEGVSATGAANELIATRDGLRQTTIDLMQLVKVLQGGVDVNGDGHPDLSTSRIYYAGQSFGGIYGVQLLGLDPDIRAGVPNVPGGPIVEIARLSPSFRPLVGISLLTHSPSLYNAIPNASFTNFNENFPLRNLPTVIATPDQLAIQQFLDWSIWEQQTGNPAAYAPYISQPVIIQFARGDKTVPNPTTSAIIRAGHLQSRTTIFRNDKAFASVAGYTITNPHTFLTNVFDPSDPAATQFAFEAQQQIATFLASDGATTIDPDGAGPYFETPTSMVPEDLGFIP
jgi:Big-like domain-containing protein